MSGSTCLEPLRQVLVDKVDGGVRDPRPMSPDGVCHVSDADGVQVLAILGIQRPFRNGAS
jgi:hypothetical protein